MQSESKLNFCSRNSCRPKSVHSYFFSVYFFILLIFTLIAHFSTPVKAATVLRIGSMSGNEPIREMGDGMVASGLCIHSQRKTRHQQGLGSRLISLAKYRSCSCGRILCPVCASNGITYNNLCEFNCTKESKPELSISHRGRCSTRRRKMKYNAEASMQA